MNFEEVQTMNDLGQWLAIHMPDAIVDEVMGEIVISTGLALAMGDELVPIEEEGDE